MRFLTEPPPAIPARVELLEIVTPRTNAAAITPAENLLAAISLAEPFALEIAATESERWFLARAGSPTMSRHLERQLAVAYPQAELRRLDAERYPGVDPAWLRPGEQVSACALVLRAAPYLPLRTFDDAEVNAERNAQADPVLGILGALDDLPDGWRGLAQLVLRPAPEDWCRSYLRLAVDHPLAAERYAGRADTSLNSVFMMAGLLVAGMLAWQGYKWYADGAWLRFTLVAAGVSAAIPAVALAILRLNKKAIYDPQLVREKVSRIAYLSQIRLAIFAPAEVQKAEIEKRLAQLAGAYRQFSLASGNGLVARRLDMRGRDLRLVASLPGARAAVLNMRELAGLWHLPQGQADVPLMERTASRQRLPLPSTVACGCRIGESTHQGRVVPVSLSDEILHRHLLLVAKTRRGKSSLLLRIARYLMEARPSIGQSPALVLVDPHTDLARAALGLVPSSRRNSVVYLDVAQREHPFGLNLLDTGLFTDRDGAVANALTIFRREFDRFWGPRMEDAFRHALHTLYEANRAMCDADPNGRTRQHTILDVPALLVDPAFRRGVLELVSDQAIKGWWSGYFDLLDRRLQIEISNPVQTKVQRFTGSRAARAIIGQPQSTIDPTLWLRDGAIVIINTAKGAIGEDTAALIGATLLNLLSLTVGEQAKLDVATRRPVTLLVDEFHTIPGADYESILSELAKFGANLVLATQSLARLEALDRDGQRALRASVFANLDGLFAFHTSAEDARCLVHELAEEVDEQDLVNLGEHQCYVKLSSAGERLPTFSVRLDRPPEGDRALAEELAIASALRYGRDIAAVEQSLLSALARIELSHRSAFDQSQAGKGGAGVARGASAADGKGGSPSAGSVPRNENRKRKPPRAPANQGTLFDPTTVETDEPSNGATLAATDGDEAIGEGEQSA